MSFRAPSKSDAPGPSALLRSNNGLGRYTDEEYAQHLVDSSWPRDDTDEMMMLAKRFDLRFVDFQQEQFFNSQTWCCCLGWGRVQLCITTRNVFLQRFQVVADRMRSARNVEDIKARFYSIMRKLLEERNLLESTPENILFCRPFDKSYVSRTAPLHFTRFFIAS